MKRKGWEFIKMYGVQLEVASSLETRCKWILLLRRWPVSPTVARFSAYKFSRAQPQVSILVNNREKFSPNNFPDNNQNDDGSQLSELILASIGKFAILSSSFCLAFQ